MDLTNLPIGFFQDYNPKNGELRKQLVKNITKININDSNILKDIFFSDENIELINKQIILTIWKRSNNTYKIGFQNKNNLLIIMQYIFLENARHLPYNIKGQIRDLNCQVIGEILPNIITNFEQKLGYLRDIEKRQPILDLPKSSTADRTLPSSNRENFMNL
jgi:hypothetical protein